MTAKISTALLVDLGTTSPMNLETSVYRGTARPSTNKGTSSRPSKKGRSYAITIKMNGLFCKTCKIDVFFIKEGSLRKSTTII